jgi:hypothetical protein
MKIQDLKTGCYLVLTILFISMSFTLENQLYNQLFSGLSLISIVILTKNNINSKSNEL